MREGSLEPPLDVQEGNVRGQEARCPVWNQMCCCRLTCYWQICFKATSQPSFLTGESEKVQVPALTCHHPRSGPMNPEQKIVLIEIHVVEMALVHRCFRTTLQSKSLCSQKSEAGPNNEQNDKALLPGWGCFTTTWKRKSGFHNNNFIQTMVNVSVSNFLVLCAGLTATKVSDHRFDPAAGLAVPNFGDPAVRDGSDSDSDSAATLVLGSWEILNCKWGVGKIANTIANISNNVSLLDNKNNAGQRFPAPSLIDEDWRPVCAVTVLKHACSPCREAFAGCGLLGATLLWESNSQPSPEMFDTFNILRLIPRHYGCIMCIMGNFETAIYFKTWSTNDTVSGAVVRNLYLS